MGSCPSSFLEVYLEIDFDIFLLTFLAISGVTSSAEITRIFILPIFPPSFVKKIYSYFFCPFTKSFMSRPVALLTLNRAIIDSTTPTTYF